MAQQNDRWSEMLAAFRALGGRAENVCLKEGRFGRGLFPVDRSRPILVRIPDALLVDVQYIRFDGAGAFRLASSAPVDRQQRSFLENYQRDFSWEAGREGTLVLVQMLQAAPEELRTFLKAAFKMDAWFDGPLPQTVAERFFSARYIGYRDRGVLMPIVELANHGCVARYEREDGIGISGTFADEILVRYGDDHPLEIFENWGFASDGEGFALCLPLRIETESGPLVIRRDKAAPGADRDLLPAMSAEDGRTELSLMLIGHKTNPRLPRENFYRATAALGWSRSQAEETFDRIQQINHSALDKLMQVAEGAAPPLRRLLHRVAKLQLELMSCCATREDV